MTDIEIAHKATKRDIKEIAKKLNLEEKDLILYGNDKAKINTLKDDKERCFPQDHLHISQTMHTQVFHQWIPVKSQKFERPSTNMLSRIFIGRLLWRIWFGCPPCRKVSSAVRSVRLQEVLFIST